MYYRRVPRKQGLSSPFTVTPGWIKHQLRRSAADSPAGWRVSPRGGIVVCEPLCVLPGVPSDLTLGVTPGGQRSVDTVLGRLGLVGRRLAGTS